MNPPSINPRSLRQLLQAYTLRLQQREREQLAKLLPHLVGFRFVVLVQDEAQLPQALWLKAELTGRLAHCWVMATRSGSQMDLQVRTEQLPIATHSVDAVIVCHGLEQSEQPHQLLREIDRILCERGQLIVLGYNPLRPSALARQLAWPWRRSALRGGLTPARVTDWLGLLDFEVVALHCYGSFRPALQLPQWAQRVLAPLRPAYVIAARKRRLPMTPTGLLRRNRRLPASPAAVANVSSARSHLRVVK